MRFRSFWKRIGSLFPMPGSAHQGDSISMRIMPTTDVAPRLSPISTYAKSALTLKAGSTIRIRIA